MATRKARLSEAHQFFEGQDAETQNADTDTTSERVISLSSTESWILLQCRADETFLLA